MTAPALDATHDPALRSWVPGANDGATDFPVQNLPFGRLRRDGDGGAPWRAGVAIGDQVLDLRAALQAGAWPAPVRNGLQPLAAGDLNGFMALGPAAWRALRAALSQALAAGSPQAAALGRCLVPQAGAELGLPCRIGDYTDFYTGVHHATAIGRLLRPDQPLLPNYLWLPIGYHGRASSIVASGRPVRRPHGQLLQEGGTPRLAPSQRVDHEAELGFVVGTGNALGTPVPLAQAGDHLFGVLLLNDWSARDIQAWEYQPLGPFLAKNFATTVSPWLVTMAALAPFRGALQRPAGAPPPLPYLHGAADAAHGALDIVLEAWIETAAMRAHGLPAERLSSARSAEAACWTAAQLVAHHTVGGCNLNPGDLLGSGTLSGPQPHEAGSLMELSHGGRQPLALANGETRCFLADGDRLALRGHCRRDGAVRIGFGEAGALLLPA